MDSAQLPSLRRRGAALAAGWFTMTRSLLIDRCAARFAENHPGASAPPLLRKEGNLLLCCVFFALTLDAPRFPCIFRVTIFHLYGSLKDMDTWIGDLKHACRLLARN